jgi:hypothetical protein
MLDQETAIGGTVAKYPRQKLVLTDAVASQSAMREHAIKATMAVMIATALHAIATGNMLPSFVMQDDGMRAHHMRGLVRVRRVEAEGAGAIRTRRISRHPKISSSSARSRSCWICCARRRAGRVNPYPLLPIT